MLLHLLTILFPFLLQSLLSWCATFSYPGDKGGLALSFPDVLRASCPSLHLRVLLPSSQADSKARGLGVAHSP